ncbi:TetR/AcrR family transcriptional regulator [Sphingosinicella terrae]|uniref:TetR/AcrR family transcriptional regulator n=1 Tax=Sphingosinicella terrae TaxID=2172047 RepID=UPI000E0CEFAF|nr:TetR/AcrR family transcriptional regulator [Sphingosinicella terrae]
MVPPAATTRDEILIAADDLFYSEGLSAVSMDRIAARAGVTKKTLYYHFRSKDDLMGAYLEARRAPVLERYQGWAGTTGSTAERMSRVFRKLAAAASDPSWHGCGFLRAACELAHLPGHPASLAARRHKKEFEAWMRSMLEEEGRADSPGLARALMILLDGAIVHTLIHRDPAYAEAAATTVDVLLATTANPANTAARCQPPPSAERLRA